MFAECYVFVKQSHGPVHCALVYTRDPFSRSYGARLPSSLTRFLSRALVYLYPPTCVGFGTDSGLITRSFSWRLSITQSGLPKKSLPHVSELRLRIFLKSLPTHLKALFHQYSALAFPVLHRSNSYRKLRNINRMSIAYAFRPRLRVRLTLGGRTCPRKPWDSGDQDSHLVFRYSCPHNHYSEVHHRLRVWLQPVRVRSSTISRSAISAHSLLPIIFGAGSLDQSAVTHCLNDGCL